MVSAPDTYTTLRTKGFHVTVHFRIGTAYLEEDIDAEDFGQRLLNLRYNRYNEELVDGGSYYAIGENRDIDSRSPTRRGGIMARMNRK